MKEEELVVASEPFERTFAISASNLVQNSATGQCWVPDCELHVDISELVSRRLKDLSVLEELVFIVVLILLFDHIFLN